MPHLFFWLLLLVVLVFFFCTSVIRLIELSTGWMALTYNKWWNVWMNGYASGARYGLRDFRKSHFLHCKLMCGYRTFLQEIKMWHSSYVLRTTLYILHILFLYLASNNGISISSFHANCFDSNVFLNIFFNYWYIRLSGPSMSIIFISYCVTVLENKHILKH